jgi:tetratricopeptide (TPR) repeat protein
MHRVRGRRRALKPGPVGAGGRTRYIRGAVGDGDERDEPRDETVTATTTDANADADPAAPEETAVGGRDRAPGLGAELPTILRDRYEILGVHGRGGIGVVFDAYDRTLRRQVALKELQAYGRRSQARFVREALITARLDHPGIVSVYEAGTWPDGRALYAMKMVKGEPLKELLARAATQAERLALIPNVIAVADAVAYAHAKRIIHRDLKPANVIVGAFGETVVIDWGLAKDLGEPDRVDAPPDDAADDDDGQLTRTGAVMGTPAYMAPEQFSSAEVDERADVYALGMMLRDLIARDPARRTRSPVGPAGAPTAPDPEQPLRELDQEQGRAPPELVAIARRALAPDPGDRYRDAGELADELRRFQSGQLISAHSYSAWELARRWISRHRGRLALAAMLAIGAVAAVVGYRARGEARPACEAAPDTFVRIWDPQVESAMHAAFRATGTPFAESSFTATATPLERYVGRWRDLYAESCRDTYWRGSQSPELLDLRTQCLDDRKAELAALTARLTAPSDRHVLDHAASAVEQLVPIDYCRDPNNLRADAAPPAGKAVTAQRVRIRAVLADARARRLTGDYAGAEQRIEDLLGHEHDVEPYLVAKLQLELGEARSLLAEDDAASAAFEAAYLAALHQRNSQVLLDAAAGRIEVSARNGRFGDADHWEKLLLARIDIATDPRAKSRGLRAQGALELARGHFGTAADVLQRAVDASDAAPYPVEHAESLLDLGGAIYDGDLERTPGYRDYYARAYQLLVSRLGAEHPATLRALVDPSNEASLHQVLAADDRLHVLPVRTRLRAMSSLARLLVHAHRFDEGSALLTRARTLAERRLGPASLELAEVYDLVGSVEYHQGHLDACQAANQERLRILEQVVGPDNPLIASANNNIGLVLKEQGRQDEAMDHFERALKIYAREPTGHFGSRGHTLNNMAMVLENRGKIDDAIALYLQSAEQRALANGPTSASVGDSYTNLGNLLGKQKRYDEAVDYQRRALAIYEQAHATERAATGHEHPDLAWPLTALGVIAIERHHEADAVPLLERAERIRREGHVSPRELGHTRFALARAAWGADHDRRRARQLLDQAAATYRGGKTPADRDELRDLIAWRRRAGL